jgi:predicted dehydrogenase
MSRRQDRREFLKTAAIAGVGFWVAGPSRAEEKREPASECIRFACIGVGGKGESDAAAAAAHGDVVAICDVDAETLEKAARRYPAAEKFRDYRKLLDAMEKRIDAVTVSIPDHMHAVVSAAAMRRGKHCFTQKPLARCLHEARRLGEIAREMKVATQMGNQGTAASRLRRAAALIRAGAIGAVKEVHVWTNRPIWDQGVPRPAEAPIPARLDWDLWLGAAPSRPYGNGYHPFAWRGFWDFGTGALGDMGCHDINMPFMALELRDPSAVEAECSGHDKESFPKWSIVRYAFPARDGRPALSLVWYDGGKRPPADLLDGEMPRASGCLVIGERGKLASGGDRRGFRLLGGAAEPKVEFEESPGHFTEFVRAMKGGPAAKSSFPDYAGPLCETVLLGNLALWAGKKIEWDAKRLAATNAPEAAALIRPEYRKGYEL